MAGKEFFEALTLELIEGMPSQRTEETLHLDFKTTRSLDFSARDDKRLFSTAASGFANSEGGVVVWGIEAKPNDEGFDCARDLKPISKIATFVERLKALSAECTSPPVVGIEHRAYARQDGSGFAASYIPESDTGPHMAKLGEDRYYRRNARSFLGMEHFEIADMFGRRPQPRLSIAWRKVVGAEVEFNIGLRNDGRGSATAPYLALEPHAHPWQWNPFGLDGNRNEGMTRRAPAPPGYSLLYYEGTDFVIHPGITLEIAKFSIPFQHQGKQLVMPSSGVLTLQYQLCAENLPLLTSLLHIKLKDLGVQVA